MYQKLVIIVLDVLCHFVLKNGMSFFFKQLESTFNISFSKNLAMPLFTKRNHKDTCYLLNIQVTNKGRKNIGYQNKAHNKNGFPLSLLL